VACGGAVGVGSPLHAAWTNATTGTMARSVFMHNGVRRFAAKIKRAASNADVRHRPHDQNVTAVGAGCALTTGVVGCARAAPGDGTSMLAKCFSVALESA
jgi:hypothetical protein